MAPRNNRGKQKGEKKKKKREEKLRPVVLDITVNLPDDSRVTLKGVSTDKVIDVRRLLGGNTVTCAITSYSLSHEIRGPRLNDAVDVAALKPCILTLVQEDYDHSGAEAHVRRLLDVVSCTAFFGPADDVAGGRRRRRYKAGKDVSGRGDARADKSSSSALAPAALDAVLDEEGETSGSRPWLGKFYEFFSLAHLNPPFQYVRKSDGKNVGADRLENHFFTLEVKLCNGKLVVVEACREGFYAVGKGRIFDHNLVHLLRQCSRAFENAYEELMHAFYKRNKFGNLPYGYRANTWLVPPAAAHLPSVFRPLPTEDEVWGGHGGGLGRDGKYDLIPWAKEFSFLTAMPCKTVEERLIRDRRAFLAHSLYVDVAIFRAVSAIRHVIGRSKLNLSSGKDDILHFERVGDLNITVMRDALNASCKINTKVDGTRTLEIESKDVLERNILKGITADENSVVHDFATLGIVNVRYCGHIALVKVQASKENGTGLACESSIMHNHTECGANALNINSLRMLLHKQYSLDLRKTVPTESKLEEEELKAALIFSKKVLKESLVQLINEDQVDEESLRWELGACWIQHLQDQLTIEECKKEKGVGTRAKTDLTVEGIGKPLKILKNIHKNSTLSNQDTDLTVVQGKSGTVWSVQDLEAKNELYLKELLSDSVFTRLKKSKTGLHCKSILELINLAKKYYNEVALPKLVADFGSLELSPVDGQTLTDVMHARGVQMHSLGHVVELSVKLTHIRSLCIHEMVVRAFKHLLRAVIAALVDVRQMAITIAASLNLMLGVSETGKSDSAHCIDALVWQWLEAFLLKRYGWQLEISHYQDIRKFAILRGLCQKVGLELAPRDFDFNCSNPFQKSDIVSLVPVHKQVCCLSADGRQFLESSKTALEKGKLEEAVDFGSKALARLVAVCGPFHRMTAGAYSLFAVVLYHTGDFEQAAIYQQKALDINERELGLDHPDTMKSYGDLAVFYYRLQHTELALGYVKRALYLLLHLTCGPSHPNTAATYINMAMMEEGLGNVSIALRYLHKALNCNKKLLGPDHVQTAASYHAIAVALSLMEAYSLSVQHEWTTLQILQAKLGPDDLRTQDAAAWLEYFESKVVEQKEAARNGTRKPDTTIASKGHQSLSDLLEFINPNRTYEERPVVALNKKKSGVKACRISVKAKLNSANSLLTTDLFIKDSSSMSFKEEKHVDECLREDSLENVRDTMASEILANTIDKNVNDCKFSIFNESVGNINSECEEGWQPVRPKSAVQVGLRDGQGKERIEKLRCNTKGTGANIIGYEANNIRYSGCCRFKNSTFTHGKYEDDHSVRVHYSSGNFGHTMKSMAYRVKSQPLSEMVGTVPIIVGELSNPPSKPLEQIDAIEVTTAGTDSRIISCGRSPSYRDVALTSPGPLAKMQMIMSKEQHVESRWKTSENQVEGFMCNVFKLQDPIPSANGQIHSEKINSVELNEKLNTIEIREEGFLKDIMPNSGFCANGGHENEDAHADSNGLVPGNEDNNSVCGSEEVALTSNQFEKGNNSDSSSLGIYSEIEDKFVTAETMDVNLKVTMLGSIENEDFPSKKLSASAVPFNPSAAITRGSLSPIGSPPIYQCYPNVSLHPGFASEVSTGASAWTSAHQPFISSPISPSILHKVQLTYPPDSKPQVQSRNLSPKNCMFYPNSMSWLSTVSNVADSVSTVAWPPYYPMDHLVMPLEVNLKNRMAMDTEVDSKKTGVIFPASWGNVGTMENLKRAENFIADIIFSDNEQDEKDLWNNSRSGLNILDTDGNTDKELEPLVLTKECSENALEKLQSSKTEIASISNSTRGRRKGKHTLEVPMRSLSRPYERQSFKLIYNKIILGSEVPKSRVHIPSAD